MMPRITSIVFVVGFYAALAAVVLMAGFTIQSTALLIAALLAITFMLWAPRR
jgi:hypothetical protein